MRTNNKEVTLAGGGYDLPTLQRSSKKYFILDSQFIALDSHTTCLYGLP